MWWLHDSSIEWITEYASELFVYFSIYYLPVSCSGLIFNVIMFSRTLFSLTSSVLHSVRLPGRSPEGRQKWCLFYLSFGFLVATDNDYLIYRIQLSFSSLHDYISHGKLVFWLLSYVSSLMSLVCLLLLNTQL